MFLTDFADNVGDELCGVFFFLCLHGADIGIPVFIDLNNIIAQSFL